MRSEEREARASFRFLSERRVGVVDGRDMAETGGHGTWYRVHLFVTRRGAPLPTPLASRFRGKDGWVWLAAFGDRCITRRPRAGGDPGESFDRLPSTGSRHGGLSAGRTNHTARDPQRGSYAKVSSDGDPGESFDKLPSAGSRHGGLSAERMNHTARHPQPGSYAKVSSGGDPGRPSTGFLRHAPATADFQQDE